MTRPRNKQSGIALLTVLLILAVMVVIAANMSSRLQLDLRRTSNLVSNQQALWYAYGAESLVEKVLKETLDDDKTINLSQNWAKEGLVYPVDNGQISGQVFDMQACFNLNAVVGNDDEKGAAPLAVRQFRNLLEQLEIEAYDAEQLSDALRDWIDTDTNVVSSYGAEDAHYESLTPPYQPANQPLRSASELRAIKGFTQVIYKKVRPYVCALPVSTLVVNVNTIDEKQPALLAAMFLGKLSLDLASSVLEQRADGGWDNIADMLALNSFSGVSLEADEKASVGVSSKYFVAKLYAEFGDAKAKFETVFNAESKSKVYVIRRQFGGAQ